MRSFQAQKASIAAALPADTAIALGMQSLLAKSWESGRHRHMEVHVNQPQTGSEGAGLIWDGGLQCNAAEFNC